MSQQSFSAFRTKLAADEALRTEATSALGTNGGIDQLVEFAKAHGYAFDADDVRNGIELSDDELDSVSGGTTLLSACCSGTHIKDAILIT
jgi:predicted ribosomally synthesized peptide with nif11-like leader